MLVNTLTLLLKRVSNVNTVTLVVPISTIPKLLALEVYLFTLSSSRPSLVNSLALKKVASRVSWRSLII